jgi:integrase
MRLKELQRWMRHGKIEMTADVYLHISKEREKELADGLQNMLSATHESKDNFIKEKLNRA